MISIVDTGGANLASIGNALARLGREAEVTADPARIRASSHVILPGVGAAGDAMARIDARGLAPVLRGLTQPVLGICLGLQLLFERSEEGDARCLGILPGTVTALRPAPGTSVPHMGWNRLDLRGPAHPLLAGVGPGSYFYFVHSYRAPDGDFVRATTQHGGDVVAVVARDNFVGVQFHPERSGPAGADLLARFLAS